MMELMGAHPPNALVLSPKQPADVHLLSPEVVELFPCGCGLPEPLLDLCVSVSSVREYGSEVLCLSDSFHWCAVGEVYVRASWSHCKELTFGRFENKDTQLYRIRFSSAL